MSAGTTTTTAATSASAATAATAAGTGLGHATAAGVTLRCLGAGCATIADALERGCAAIAAWPLGALQPALRAAATTARSLDVLQRSLRVAPYAGVGPWGVRQLALRVAPAAGIGPGGVRQPALCVAPSTGVGP
jgi:hypothetical protein